MLGLVGYAFVPSVIYHYFSKAHMLPFFWCSIWIGMCGAVEGAVGTNRV